MSSLLHLVRTWVNRSEERRRDPRIRRVTFVTLQPLNEEFAATGPLLWGMTRNYSVNGIGITCRTPMPTQHIQVMIHADQVSRVAEVRHQKRISQPHENVLHFIGLEWFRRWN